MHRLNVTVTDDPNLTDWLAGRSADQLADVLRNRPDVSGARRCAGWTISPLG